MLGSLSVAQVPGRHGFYQQPLRLSSVAGGMTAPAVRPPWNSMWDPHRSRAIRHVRPVNPGWAVHSTLPLHRASARIFA